MTYYSDHFGFNAVPEGRRRPQALATESSWSVL